MRWLITAVVIASVSMWGGFAGAAQAQIAGPVIQTQGTLNAVSVDALTFSVIGPGGPQPFHVTSVTVFYAGTERIDFDRLSEFIGAVAVVWSAPIESEQIAGIVTLLVFPVSGVITPGVNPGNGDLGGGPAIGGGGGNNGGGGGNNGGGGGNNGGGGGNNGGGGGNNGGGGGGG
ncbi:MAG TPA: hypothetical protein VGX75_11985, partial [bacterium]|nr:hypothetical protein [bacterium]